MKKIMGLVILATSLSAGCRVQKNENANGTDTYSVEPAKVNVSTESTTVAVPKVELAPDTSRDTTHTTTR